jgi:hypothetical protein
MAKLNKPKIDALGITNQRETTVGSYLSFSPHADHFLYQPRSVLMRTFWSGTRYVFRIDVHAAVWDKHSGKPYHNAIVWNDTCTSSICELLAMEDGWDKDRYRVHLSD